MVRKDSEDPSMTFPKARLVVAACLFLGWLGFLFYLVVNARTVVLSKPQFLIAQAFVVVDVGADGGSAADDSGIVRARPSARLRRSGQVPAAAHQVVGPLADRTVAAARLLSGSTADARLCRSDRYLFTTAGAASADRGSAQV